MKEIDEKILEYCGIYNRPKVEEKTIKEILNIKKEIEKTTGIKIERVYLYGDNYWGKNPKLEKAEICFLTDVRLYDLDEGYSKIVTSYPELSFLYWNLSQFEKRCQSPREAEYYIQRYGAIIYDSGKKTEIDENINNTSYSFRYNYFKKYDKKYIKKDRNGILMRTLLIIYLLKIGYYVPDIDTDIFAYVDYVNEDENVKKILEEYQKKENIEEKTKICKKFELYMNENVKEYIKHYKLKEEPTMLVYEKLEKKFKENGPLDIKTLTKDDLYIMYVLQKKNGYEIAKLYDVSTEKIREKRNNWKIKLREEVMSVESIREMIKERNEINKSLIYTSFKKMGLLSFEECIMPILKFMKNGDSYLLKEFWKFTEFEQNSMEKQFIGSNITTFYRATYCLEFLKDNNLVKEIEFKKYRITKEGKAFVSKYQQYYTYTEKPIMELLLKMLNKVNLFGIVYTNKEEFVYKVESIAPKENKKVVVYEEEERLKVEVKEIEKEEISIEEQINNIKKVDFVQKEKKKTSKVSTKAPRKRDYVKETQDKTAFGKKCENIIYEKEKRDLVNAGRSDLAEKVEWVSQKPGGDGEGYDIISFRKVNNKFEEVYIEVKGTNKDYDEAFEISRLEVETSEKYGDRYYICRVAKANDKCPIYYEQKGSIRENYDLKPMVYKATKK